MADTSFLSDDVDETMGPLALAGSFGTLSPRDLQVPDYLRSQMDEGQQLTRGALSQLTGYETEAEKAAASKRAAIQAGLDALLAQQQNPDKTATLLALASGFLKPTRGGGFTESLGQAGEAAIPAILQDRQRQDQQNAKGLDYRLKLADLDAELNKTRMSSALERAKLGRGISSDAAKLEQQRELFLGRQAGARDLAAYRATLGKSQAQRDAEFLYPNDPEKQQAYVLQVTTQAKEKQPVATPSSPEGKKAADEGLEPGTPEFTRRVKELQGYDLMTPEERQAQAEALGVPLLSVDPYAGLNPNQAAQARSRQVAAAQKRIDEDAEAVRQGQGIRASAQRFLDLLPQIYTGAWRGLPLAQNSLLLSEPAQEAKSVSDKLVPGMRQGLPGAASDRDVAMFRSAALGLEKGPEANRNVATGIIESGKLAEERLGFMENYLLVNKTLQGAESAWNKYLTDNPIFDHSEEATRSKSYELNKNRVPWQEYFKGNRREPEASLEELEAERARRKARGGRVR